MFRTSAVLLLTLAAAPAFAGDGGGDAEAFFEAKVRPLLADRCFKCHGEKKQNGGLRLDRRESLLAGGDGGPAVVPGDPEKSLLIRAVRHTHESLKMPPDRRLPDDAVADLAAWVKAGAVWPASRNSPRPDAAAANHWAFRPVRKPSPPAVRDASWPKGDIDRFVLAELEANGLKPAPPADKRTLIRRVTFDLTGLPPTPEEIDAFLKDESPDAFAKVVDRLLASPRYGERWGRHWLDVARYADTAGDNADYPVPEVRRYRDYVIDSFNADKPFDRFVVEQLAGDILAQRGPPERYAERVVATGFLALARRYATAPYEFWHLSLEDAIDTTGQAFLGLTLRCARCHDHKFDPVTREDYYGLYAIFAATQFPYAGSEEFASMSKPRQHFVPLVPASEAAPRLAAYRERLKQLRAEIPRVEKESPPAKRVADLNRQLGELTKDLRAKEQAKEDVAPLRKRLTELTAQRDAAGRQLQEALAPLRGELRTLERNGLPPDLPAAYAVSDGKPIPTHIHLRGEPDRPGPRAPRSVVKFLAGKRPVTFPEDSSGRLELAEWVASKDNPLTARVIVNRIWQGHFGTGIVPTPNNFGLRGEPPSHSELLDHLAAEFVADGWSIKKLHRRILLSATYQQASRVRSAECGVRNEDAALACAAGWSAVFSSIPHSALRTPRSIDPANRLLWHFERRRLDAEAIRDAMLFVSGKLDMRRPGPHPFPPIAVWGWTQHHPFKDVYASNHRSVYLMTQRLQRHPFLALFDGPDTNASTGRRPTSTVPLQALYLLNNPFVREQAEGLAARLIASGPDAAKRVALAHEIAWGRPATPEEVSKGVAYVARYKQELAKAGTPADRAEHEAWASFARVLLMANEFVFVD